MAEKVLKKIDWLLICFVVPIILAGLVTMKSFAQGEGAGNFFGKQIVWVLVCFAVFFIFSFIDFRFLKRTDVLVTLFLSLSGILMVIFILGHVSHGAKSWFSLGLFSFQPADLMKLVLILILSKYFSRRHVEIRNIKHIFISGIYALIPFILVFLQPDFGSAMIIFLIWFGMVLVSGISKIHLLTVFLCGAFIFSLLWMFVFAPYQKERISNFFNPLADIHGSGYNALQSTIAVGSGQVLGKGLGFGTQSRLKFLPEYQTDYVFAAFAEEWGFIGVLILLLLFGVIIWRILANAMVGATNFETLFGLGLASIFLFHFIVHVGMNVGLLPVTGITMPFMSYGGSHMIAEFLGIGILMSQSSYAGATNKEGEKNEI